MLHVEQWRSQLLAEAYPKKAAHLSRFFKTGKGEYAEGDVMLGINVPINRSISKQYCALPIGEIAEMLHSPEHEFRLGALIALVEKYRREPDARREIVQCYIGNMEHINNWDLVDLSAPGILGQHQLLHPTLPLLEPLSHSRLLWPRRIAIVGTLTLIRNGSFDLTLQLAEQYLSACEDLLHKATGWMLREVGKRSEPALLAFLDAHAATMPRTALRYAIEWLQPHQRQHYMAIGKKQRARGAKKQ